MKDYAEIVCIIDRSGSMSSVKDDAIGGFNTFLEGQKGEPGDAKLTLVLFDDQYEVPIQGKDIQEVEPLTDKTFVPRGATALHDAIGKTINDLGTRLTSAPEAERPKVVIVVILTDGFENASREFTGEGIKQMVEHQQSVYNWKFIYLAADQDAVTVGGSMGIPQHMTQSYHGDGAGTRSAYAVTGQTVSGIRAGEDVDLQGNKAKGETGN